MVDVGLLQKKINASGLKTRFIASEMGITPQALYLKLGNGNCSWTYSQAITIQRLLGLSDGEMESIFFAA